MKSICLTSEQGLTREQVVEAVAQSLSGYYQGVRVLLVPPDITRLHSHAGEIAGFYYRILNSLGARVDVLPALGTHRPMDETQLMSMFPDIPLDRFLVHDWRGGVDELGEIPGELVRELSEGKLDFAIRVQLSRHLTQGDYGFVLCLGQVVPHEVMGMSSHLKQLFVGLGGSDMINKTHFVGAVYGAERLMGRDHMPPRQLLDWAGEAYLGGLPVGYALTVVEDGRLKGLFIGEGRAGFEQAVACSQAHNITTLPKRVNKVVCYLPQEEYHTTWLGNKAVYRTRQIIEQGGELLILAPGVQGFGEDAENDRLIRAYGYRGREGVLKLAGAGGPLADNLSVAAHLIHGSSDGAFSITYAAGGLDEGQLRGVGYGYASCAQAMERYSPAKLSEGFNRLDDGEEIFFVSNPGAGLWAVAP